MMLPIQKSDKKEIRKREQKHIGRARYKLTIGLARDIASCDRMIAKNRCSNSQAGLHQFIKSRTLKYGEVNQIHSWYRVGNERFQYLYSV